MNANAAQIDITPDFAVDLSGYASRTQPSTGVLEPIFARALYLEDGTERLLWIACDVIAFERDFVEAFRNWARRELKLEPRQVLLSATHTHTAPGTIRLTAAGAYSERYVTMLQERLRDVARRAAATLEPCEVLAGRETLNLAIDRRNKPTAHVDPYVWGLAFARKDRSLIAAVINYAMHPVSHGHLERQISPDWCGAASTIASFELPGRPITLVCNGAAGNINPPMVDQSIEGVHSFGQRIARAAMRALGPAKPRAGSLATRSITVRVPLDWHDDAGIDRVAEAQLATIRPGWVWEHPFKEAVNGWRKTLKPIVAAGGGREVPIELQAIRIGDVTIVAVNGEMFTRFTEYLRQCAGENVFVVAYANSAFGYIPTREAYEEGGYEVETAHFFYNSFRPKPGGLELLADRAVELIKALA